MSSTFRRHGEAIRFVLRPPEAELLRRLRDELRRSLEDPDPEDAVVARLFPPVVLGDAEADRAARDLLAEELLADRLAGLDLLADILERARVSRGRLTVDLVEEEPLLVLGVLNDVRLALGARIDVEALDRASVGPEDPLAYPLAIMDHLGWWQEQLLELLDGDDQDAEGPS
ncbi:MAG: DUF2017 family protein [Nitriliruptoraceae bacterium]